MKILHHANTFMTYSKYIPVDKLKKRCHEIKPNIFPAENNGSAKTKRKAVKDKNWIYLSLKVPHFAEKNFSG